MAEQNKPHYHGHRKRLRQRLMRDSRSLADYELLELILALTVPRQDTKPLAKEMIEHFGNLRGALAAPLQQLSKLKGFGPALEAQWVLLREMRARISEPDVEGKEYLSSPMAVLDGAMVRLGHKGIEEFWVALVDNKNRAIAWEMISRGTVDNTAVYPREVMAMALKHEASGLILVHNHPGGDPRPSEADKMLTMKLVTAASQLNIRLLDHLVVTDSDHFSFQENGLL